MHSFISFIDKFNPCKKHCFQIHHSGKVRYRQLIYPSRVNPLKIPTYISRIESGSSTPYTEEYLIPLVKKWNISLRELGRRGGSIVFVNKNS